MTHTRMACRPLNTPEAKLPDSITRVLSHRFMIRTISSLFTLAGVLISCGLSAQTLTGLVTDENGGPMPGATIVANGGARGVSSDVDGRYNLTLGEGEHTISFSFVGYVKVTKTSVTLAAGETKTVPRTCQLEADAVLDGRRGGRLDTACSAEKEVTGSIASNRLQANHGGAHAELRGGTCKDKLRACK